METPINKTLKSLKIIDGNVVEIAYNDNVHVEFADMVELLRCVDEFTNSKPFKRLVVISPKATIDRDARKYLQTENHAKRKNIIAEAVIVHSLAHKMTFNIYAKLIKDIYPSKYFMDMEEARTWLSDKG